MSRPHARPAARLGAMLLGAILFAWAPGSGGARAGTEPDAPASPSDPRPIDPSRFHTLSPGEYAGYNKRASLMQRGRVVYATHCEGCHGEAGDGKGPAAKRLITKPRDFTSGIFKFRSTDSGSLPLETDLHRTITRGLARVSMPAFPFMTEQDKLAVIEYVKGFYPQWQEQKAGAVVVAVPRAPGDLAQAERVKRGRVVYTVMQCWRCHGTDGAGKGATQTEYVDAWDHPQKPFNFTRGRLKGGDDPQDIYRTFHTGLRSIMPAYGPSVLAAVSADSLGGLTQALEEGELAALEPYLAAFPATGAELAALDPARRAALGERNSWDLVAFILSLRRETTTAAAVLGSAP